jgi:tRNA 2-selenouridine synthase
MSAKGRPERELLPLGGMARSAKGVVTSASSPSRGGNKVSVEAIAEYADPIDVRSPSEFAEDHLPGAENRPVLDDEERARIGTMHAQDSAFAARRAGAALVARNIAAMLEGPFAGKPRDWAPLVYCWRGGQRSRSLAHMLNEIGWRAVQLDGGYRAYRRHVVAELATLPLRYRYEVICGLTGSGKSRLLGALAAEGAQVLDLEALARHRGSLLGDLPDGAQPSQKWFESQLVAALYRLDPARPVYVESESKRIGTVQVPDALLTAMRAAECIRLELAQPLRVELLKQEYAHFLADHAALAARLQHLVPLHGKATIARWTDAARAGDWDSVVGELLELHYDPTYRRSIGRNFPRIASAIAGVPAAVTDTAFRALARELDAKVHARNPAR